MFVVRNCCCQSECEGPVLVFGVLKMSVTVAGCLVQCDREAQMAKLSVHLSISWDPIPPLIGFSIYCVISLNQNSFSLNYCSWSTLLICICFLFLENSIVTKFSKGVWGWESNLPVHFALIHSRSGESKYFLSWGDYRNLWVSNFFRVLCI